ncbi:MAG TPA: hypothetical protein VGH89_42785 [Pseudonocardia sp.]
MCAQPSPGSARPSSRNVGWVAGTLLLLFLGVPICLFLVLPAGVATNACGAAQSRLACSTAVQLLVYWLPVLGLIVGLISCLVGGWWLRRADRSPMLAVALGWLLFVAGSAGTLLLVMP